ncbi:MAG TPA: DUF364 domain-containing protein [Chloroflexota bacterium]|nr:DUF364 domain-containing protein [Chloroflexota bacterium]
MGLLADLLDSVRGQPPYVTTAAVAGRRFTAAGGAAAPSGAAAAPVIAGLAYTARGESDSRYNPRAASAELESDALGRPLFELAQGALPEGNGGDQPRREVGAAALNALLGARLTGEPARSVALGAENGLDLVLRLSQGKSLVMVGRFPYLDKGRLAASRYAVLELDPQGDDLPASAAPEVLPQADVVGITGSTLANGTLEGLLALCRPEATVVLIGPTTPLSAVLFDYGADVLCGVLVDDPAAALAVLADPRVKPTPRIPGTRLVSMRRTS